MKLIGPLTVAVAALFFSSCDATKGGSERKRSVGENYSPEVLVVKYEGLIDALDKKNDTLYVVNFWATWCMPCVKELPHFVSTLKEMSGKRVKLVLVSLDTKNDLETKLIPFLRKEQFVAQHYLLDDNGRMNEWIPRFSADWDGAIPATAFYKNGAQLHFNSGALSEQELRSQINTYLNP